MPTNFFDDDGSPSKVNFFDEDYVDQVKPEATKPVAIESEKRSWARAVGDTAIDLAGKGVVSLGESLAGLGSLGTMGMVGKALDAIGYDPEATRDFFSGFQSDSLKKSQKEVDDTTGFWATAKAIAVRPDVLVSSIAQALPGTFASGAAGGALTAKILGTATKQAATLGLSAEAATAFITGKMKDSIVKIAAASAAAEGAQASGSIAEMARQSGREWDEYVLPALAGGFGTAAINMLSGGLSRKLGVGDIETSIALRAGGAGSADVVGRGILSRVPIEALKEGIAEEMPQSYQEKIFGNIALGEEDIFKGSKEAAATGLMIGAGMGGGNALTNGRKESPSSPAEPPTPPTLLLDNVSGNINPIISFPDDSSGTQADLDSFLARLPEEERIPAMARLMGLAEEQAAAPLATPADILAAPDLDSAIASAEAALAAPVEVDADLRNEQIDAAFRRHMAEKRQIEFDQAEQARREADIPAMENQVRDQKVDLANAITEAQGFDTREPTAMQLAMEAARQKSGILDAQAQPVEIPALEALTEQRQAEAQAQPVEQQSPVEEQAPVAPAIGPVTPQDDAVAARKRLLTPMSQREQIAAPAPAAQAAAAIPQEGVIDETSATALPVRNDGIGSAGSAAQEQPGAPQGLAPVQSPAEVGSNDIATEAGASLRTGVPGADSAVGATAALTPRMAVESVTSPVSYDEAISLVAGKTEKPGGVDPAKQIKAAEGNRSEYRLGDVPLSMFAKNEDGARYDGTVDIDRAVEYAGRPAEDAPPIIAVLSKKTGLLNVLDGGHRISAARLRGDDSISALVSLKPESAAPAAADATATPTSWTVTDKETGKVVIAETSDQRKIAALNPAKFEVTPIATSAQPAAAPAEAGQSAQSFAGATFPSEVAAKVFLQQNKVAASYTISKNSDSEYVLIPKAPPADPAEAAVEPVTPIKPTPTPGQQAEARDAKLAEQLTVAQRNTVKRQENIATLETMKPKALREIATSDKRAYMRNAAADILQTREQATRARRSEIGRKLWTKSKSIDPERDTMAQAIAKMGGVSSESARSRLRLAPEELSIRGKGVLRVFTSGGKTMDEIGAAMADLGYVERDENGKHDQRDFEDKLAELAGGNDIMTPQGMMIRAEENARAAFEQAGAQSGQDFDAVEDMADAAADEVEAHIVSTIGADITSEELSDEDINRIYGIESSDSSVSEVDSAGPAGQSGQGTASPEFSLESESADEGRARIAEQERRAANSAADELAAEKAEREKSEAEEVKARMDASAENFQLGQSQDDGISGQDIMWSKSDMGGTDKKGKVSDVYKDQIKVNGQWFHAQRIFGKPASSYKVGDTVIELATGAAKKKDAAPDEYVDSDLFRESGANVSHTEEKIAEYAAAMEAYGGWGKFPMVAGRISTITEDEVERYSDYESNGYASDLAYSRPITKADIGRRIVHIENGHNRAYAAARLGIKIPVYDMQKEEDEAPGYIRYSKDAKQTDTPAFRKWFGDSKVVDEDGKPLVVYHGTRGAFTVFDYSKIGEQGRAEGAGFYFTNSEDVANAYGKPMEVYLAISKPLAYDAKPFSQAVVSKLVKRISEIEAEANGDGIDNGFLSNFGDINYDGLDAVVRAAAKLISADATALDQLSGIVGSGVSPAYVNQATKEITGYDGVVANGFSNSGDADNTIYVAFFPEQIKSATDNNGDFDASNPDIRRSASRAAPNAHSTASLMPALQTALNRYGKDFAENLVATGKVKIVTSAEAAVVLGQQPEGPAFFNPKTGLTYIVADRIGKNVTADQLHGLVLHEVANHALQMSRKSADFQAILKNLATMEKAGNPAVKAAYARADDAGTSAALRNEEALGYLLEANPNVTLAQRFVAWMRAAIRAFGKALPVAQRSAWFQAIDKMSVADLTVAAQAVLQGAPNALADTMEQDGAPARASTAQGTFYSQLKRQVAASKNGTMPGNQWSAWLNSNAPKLGIKKDEIEWSGVMDYLAMRGTEKVTRDDLVNYLQENGVQVQEVTKGDAKFNGTGYDDDSDSWAYYDALGEVARSGFATEPEAAAAMRAESSYADPTKYSQYTLPGGENYRELLLTLPNKEAAYKAPAELTALPEGYGVSFDRMQPVGRQYAVIPPGQISGQPFGGVRAATAEDARAEALSVLNSENDNNARDQYREQQKRKGYTSSHWDEKNIIAHVRFNDRVDADGNKVLFIEELQSDFGQSYKKQRDTISNAVESNFQKIVDRMKAAGVLEVVCD